MRKNMPTFTIDFTPLINLGAGDPFVVAWNVFKDGGWIPVVFILAKGLWDVWTFGRQIMFDIKETNPVLLKVDIPRENVQTVKAVENMFGHLAGSMSNFVFKEKYWEGKFQPIYVFEIVSIEGYIQFYVRVWDKYRDLIESAIYAQYPQAQLTEVPPEEDYSRFGPSHFPDPEWDLFGSEMKLKFNSVLPIRTYPLFEHGTSDPEFFKDPLASLLEALASIHKGEQVWIQLLVQNTHPPEQKAWVAEGQHMVKELIGAKIEHGSKLVDKMGDIPLKALEAAGQAIFGGEAEEARKEKDKPRSEMLFLSSGEKAKVETIEQKISKYGFRAKIRWVYLAPRGQLRKGLIVSLVRGAYRQLTHHDGNEIAMDRHTTTKSDYFWQRKGIFYPLSLYMYHPMPVRQHHLMARYRARSMQRGAMFSIMNTEELATIWHFPLSDVKTPLLAKTELKRGEPPVTLPTERVFGTAKAVTSETHRGRTESPPPELPAETPAEGQSKPKEGPPENLPVR